MEENKYGIFSSSTDPSQVANTVRGIALSLSGIALIVAPLAGLSLTAEQFTNFAGQLGLAAGAIWTLYGLIQKLIVYLTKRG